MVVFLQPGVFLPDESESVWRCFLVVDIGFQFVTKSFDNAHRKIGFAITIQTSALVVGRPLGLYKRSDKVMDVVGHF